MWECGNCKEEIEDKYKHCWNCGQPKAEAPPDAAAERIHRLDDEPPPAVELRSADEVPSKAEIPPKAEIPVSEHFPFENAFAAEEKSPSIIKKIVPPVLWLAAFIAVAGFTYYSSQKTKAFENQIAEAAKNLGSQTKQFVFSKDAPREKKGVIKAKVLPLSTKNNEVDDLYRFLPDDLRPATLEEVKTLLWLDCKPGEAGLYEDGLPAYRDKCNAYLVDRNTSKVIQVQDFSGEPPPLKKQWGTSYASGKVLPEAYISYIKANQPENERAPFAYASNSPNHHFWFKSELLYAGILLILLAAVGFGWIIYKLKSARWNPK
jgi:hypothetical protein